MDTILDFFRKGTTQGLIGFVPSSDSEEEEFQFFNQSKAMAFILDVGQGHRTKFWKRIISK
jgi:hypothetical protein